MRHPFFEYNVQLAFYCTGFPDPFAVATINGEQTQTTGVIKKTLNPYWNESFDLQDGSHQTACTLCTEQAHRKATEDSILAIQIFDQKKFKKKDQGFLGVINVRIGSVIDLDVGGDGAQEEQRRIDERLINASSFRNAHQRPQEVQR